MSTLQQALHSCSLLELRGHTPVGITPTSLFLNSPLHICVWDSVGHQGCLDLEPNGTLQLLQGVRTTSSSAERKRLQQTHVGLCQLRI